MDMVTQKLLFLVFFNDYWSKGIQPKAKNKILLMCSYWYNVDLWRIIENSSFSCTYKYFVTCQILRICGWTFLALSQLTICRLETGQIELRPNQIYSRIVLKKINSDLISKYRNVERDFKKIWVFLPKCCAMFWNKWKK